MIEQDRLEALSILTGVMGTGSIVAVSLLAYYMEGSLAWIAYPAAIGGMFAGMFLSYVSRLGNK